jgi:hypothetical protein
MPPIRNSTHWMPDIAALCTAFYENKLTKKTVTYRKMVFSEIDAYCDEKVDEIKHEVFCCERGTIADGLLDRHKVAAVHVVAILKKNIFFTASQPNNTTFIDKTANEHYALLVFIAILEGWYEKIYGKLVIINLPATYKDNLILLFNMYRKSQSSNIIDNMFAYSLANIVYLVEERYLEPIGT